MRVVHHLALTVLLSCIGVPLHAQPDLTGKWKATFSTEGGDGREADVVVEGTGGTWTTYARGNKDKRDVCVGRALPITLSDGGSSTVSLVVEGSKAVDGCRDRKARLTVVDAKTLEGEFSNGRAIKLTRQ